MKKCSICDRISGTGEDHTDCIEKRRIELEAKDFKEGIPDRLGQLKSPQLSTEMKAILEHMARTKDD